MLLSRVADALYWISRYLERAEHTARLVDVAADLRLGRPATAGAGGVERLYASLGLKVAEAAGPVDLLDAALLDTKNRNSIASCVLAARENARQVREEISSDMWEQMNALYLRVRHMWDDASLAGRTQFVARSILEGVHLFGGITDATMSHGEGWQYLQAGRFLERAEGTATLLDTFLGDGTDSGGMAAPLDQADLVALLRSCSALEGYCRHYTADVRQERVIEFVLQRRVPALDPLFGLARRRRTAGADAAQRPIRRRARGAAVGPSARVAGLRPGRRDPERRRTRVPDRRQPAVRPSAQCARPELHRLPDRVGAACLTPGEPCVSRSVTSPASTTKRRSRRA
jgi:uncharacterized alpha-E superfamily protein